MITSFTNYFFPDSKTDLNIPLPEGAIVKSNPEKMEFLHQEEDYGSWKVTILNHTEFNLHYVFEGHFRTKSFGVPNMTIQYNFSRVTVAYCMENYPNLFFYETHSTDSSWFSPPPKSLKYYIDTSDTPYKYSCFEKFRPYNRSDTAKKISEISAKFTQRRISLELVLKSYSDPKSLLSELQVPHEIIGHITMLYNNVLMCEMK